MIFSYLDESFVIKNPTFNDTLNTTVGVVVHRMNDGSVRTHARNVKEFNTQLAFESVCKCTIENFRKWLQAVVGNTIKIDGEDAVVINPEFVVTYDARDEFGSFTLDVRMLRCETRVPLYRPS